MTSRNKHRLAALLALVIGLLTIVEGGIVLLGIETKPYPVLPWLLRYNVVMGFVSLAAGYGLWREQGWAAMLSRIILACHGLVFLTLAGMHLLKMIVAVNSIMAMLFRTVIWIGINFMIRGKQQEGKGQYSTLPGLALDDPCSRTFPRSSFISIQGGGKRISE